MFVVRLWKRIKYEEIYWAPAKPSARRNSIAREVAFYNGWRPHSSLDGSCSAPPGRRSSFRCGDLFDNRDRFQVQLEIIANLRSAWNVAKLEAAYGCEHGDAMLVRPARVTSGRS